MIANRSGEWTLQGFEQFLFYAITFAIETIASEDVADIYVLSFYVDDEDDDPRKPVLVFGYNTLRRLRECTPTETLASQWPVASRSDEAKWNYAFWLQNQLCYLVEESTEGAKLRLEWRKSLGYHNPDEEGLSLEEIIEDDALYAQMEQIKWFEDVLIRDAFYKVCIRIAKRIHEDRKKSLYAYFHPAEFYRPDFTSHGILPPRLGLVG